MGGFNQLLISYGATVPSVSYRTTANDTAILATTKTFASQDIGAVAANRYVVVGVTGTGNSGFSISTLTVGGIAATKVSESVGAVRGFASLWIAAVPTGTTASIVINWSGTVTRATIGVWAVYNLSSATPVATNNGSVTSTGQSCNMNVSANGIAIAVGYDNGDNGTPAVTWTGVTKRYENTAASDNNSGGDFVEGASAEAPRTISTAYTVSTASRESIAGATWL